MDTFERKQYCYVPCAISSQGTFLIVFHWCFLIPQRTESIKNSLKGMRETADQKNSEYKHFSRTEVHATNMLRFDAYVDRCGTEFSFFFQNCATFLSEKRYLRRDCYHTDYANQ